MSAPHAIETDFSRLIDRLAARGDLTAVADVETEVAAQTASLRRLQRRAAAGPPSASFLAEYDSLMRHVELCLLRSGHRLGQHPHSTMKEVVEARCGRETGIRDLVALRHAVKKEGAAAGLADVRRLVGIRERFVEAASAAWLEANIRSPK